MALDRLEAAWTAFEGLSRNERREFLRMLKDWHLQQRIEAIAARGGDLGRVPPVQEFAAAMATLDVASLTRSE